MGSIGLSITVNSLRRYIFLRFGLIGYEASAVLNTNVHLHRALASSVSSRELDAPPEKVVKKKTFIQKITLLMPNEQKIITTLEVAEKMSKRRQLILSQLQYDNVSERPVYKLMTPTEHLAGEVDPPDEPVTQAPEQKAHKSIKEIRISGKINQHDLQVKINQINRLLSKNHVVKAVISDIGSMKEKIDNFIETNTKDHGTFSKTVRTHSILCKIYPLPTNAPSSDSDNNDKNTSAT